MRRRRLPLTQARHRQIRPADGEAATAGVGAPPKTGEKHGDTGTICLLLLYYKRRIISTRLPE